MAVNNFHISLRNKGTNRQQLSLILCDTLLSCYPWDAQGILERVGGYVALEIHLIHSTLKLCMKTKADITCYFKLKLFIYPAAFFITLSQIRI